MPHRCSLSFCVEPMIRPRLNKISGESVSVRGSVADTPIRTKRPSGLRNTFNGVGSRLVRITCSKYYVCTSTSTSFFCQSFSICNNTISSRLYANSSLSFECVIAIVSNPAALAYWIPRGQSAPIPTIATRSCGFGSASLNPLYTVYPAQNIGVA